MALARFFFITSLLLLPLLIIASAKDYAYNSNPDNNKPKPKYQTYSPDQLNVDEGEPKPQNYGNESKPGADKPKPEDHGYYGSKPNLDKFNKPKSENGGYGEADQYSNPEDHGFVPKPDIEKSKSEDKPKAENYGYGLKPDSDKPKPEDEDHGYGPKLEEIEKSFPIGIQGLVLCKSGSRFYPIQGAVARITCLAVDENGYEIKSLFNCRGTTDAKGYFLASLLSPLKLTDTESLRIKECKAFLEKSLSETCKIPSDVNKGVSGALLSSYRILHDKKMKLYSLKPFFFTSETESTPNGY